MTNRVRISSPLPQHRRQSRPLHDSRDVGGVGRWLLNAVILLLPFTRLVELDFGGGVLFLHDVLTYPVLAILLIRPGSVALLRPLRTPLILISIWFAGAVITDTMLNVRFADYARGWSRIGLLAGNIVMIWLLCEGRLRYLTLYVCSLGFTMILNPLINPNDLSILDPWKFGMGYGVALIVAGSISMPLMQRTLSRAAGPIALALVALVSLYLNARSAFAIAGLAAGYAAFAGYIARRPDLAPRINPAMFVGVIIMGILLSNLLLMIYGDLASGGVLGAVAREKYYQQSGGTGIGLLLGGRPESLVSLQAIWDSPIIGHGSWARDPYYTHLFQAKLRENGLAVPDDYRDIGKMTEFLIPTHSHILGSWVEAGILSLPFWLWAVGLAFSALYSAIRVHWQPNILVALMSLSMLWDVLFSPFANDARIIKAVEICVLICAVSMLRKSPSIPGRMLRTAAPLRPERLGR